VFEFRQPSKSEDLNTMLSRLKVVDDIITYNFTFNLPVKYEVWLNAHKDMIEELEYMINEDLSKLCETGE